MRELDFLVVGAGIAGVSAAARLTRHGSVLVCEAEEAPGYHSSGRSAAFAHFGMDDDLVRRLTAASLPRFAAPCAQVHPALFTASASALPELAEAEAIHRKWSRAARRLSGDEAREFVPILRTGDEGVVAALLDPDARKLDAHAMLEGHRKTLNSAGGSLAVREPVQSLKFARGRWIVETARATYVARVVVNAAGAWADRIAQLAGIAPIGLQPRRRTVITFAGPAGMDVSSWPFTKTVGTGLYFEPEGKGRLLASPMDAKPVEPCDAQAEEEDIALAAWRMEEATTLSIRRIEARWAGLRSFAPDERPVAGYDPDAPGFFWLAGQGGFGLQTSPAMAMAVEALATGADWPEELDGYGITAGALSPARFRA